MVGFPKSHLGQKPETFRERERGIRDWESCHDSPHSKTMHCGHRHRRTDEIFGFVTSRGHDGYGDFSETAMSIS